MTLEQMLIARLRALPPQEQEKVLAFVTTIEQGVPRPPRTTAYGLWAHFGEEITEAEIAEARAEMWGAFPRESY